jgi:hypothetical protein
MGDKSPKKADDKKAGKTIKEKRAAKKAKHPNSNSPSPLMTGHQH